MDPTGYSRLKALFHQAVDLEAVGRSALLERIAATDPETAGELRTLLANHDRLGEFLEPAVVSFEAFVPEHIGNYRIDRELGAGGSGRVFLASRQDDEFKRPVALKLLDRRLFDRDFGRRFRQERRALAQLNHANIAQLLDWGDAENGAPFLVMEYVDGLPIRQYCVEQGCSTKQRLALFLQVCAAVQHAHRNLIVHRDLKPGNILVTPDGIVKLLDFGIAKLLNAEETITVTAAGKLTPAYASPEQVRGEEVTAATDVYSLGVVLFEMLTGSLPYRLATRSVAEVSRAVLEQEPERLGVSNDLDNIVLMALRKDPARRYASVEQLAADIERMQQGCRVTARPDHVTSRMRMFFRRHRVATPTGVAAALAAAVALVAVGGAGPRNTPQLIHEYTFAGDASDRIGSANGALINGAVAAAGVLRLNGVNQYVQFDSDLVPASGSYSVTLWAQETSPAPVYAELISQGSTNGPGFYIGHTPSSPRIIRASDFWRITAVVFPSDGRWHRYALVVDSDASQTRLFLDGAPSATLHLAITSLSGSTHTRLGRQFDPFKEYFQGNLADVRIYRGALGETEVAKLAADRGRD